MPDATPLIHPRAVYTADMLGPLLDVGPETLAEARRTGKLRCVKLGRRAIFLGSWVLRWVRSAELESRQGKEVAHA
jgi:hypothetical protein